MEYTIENEYLKLTVTTWGAQVRSVVRKSDGVEPSGRRTLRSGVSMPPSCSPTRARSRTALSRPRAAAMNPPSTALPGIWSMSWLP